MSNGKTKPRSRLRIIATVLAILIVAFFVWMILFPHTYQVGPVPLATAQSRCPFAFPNTARNIYIATHRHLTLAIVYIRFEAPPADCESLAQRLLPLVTPTPLEAPEAQAILAPENPGGAFSDLSWLDPQKITRGKRYLSRHINLPEIIVDSERGIFYYIQAN
jgi:hypothetical protein